MREKNEKRILIMEVIVGMVMIGIGTVTQFDYYSTMIFSMGFAFAFSAVVQIIRLTYWQSPKHKEEYERKKKKQHIDSVDERKQVIRAKAGQMAYGIMTLVLLLLAFVLALFRVEVWVIGMVYLLFLFQWGIGIVIFRILEKKM